MDRKLLDTGPASPVRPSDTGRDERYDIEEPEAIHPLVDLEELDLADERGGGGEKQADECQREILHGEREQNSEDCQRTSNLRVELAGMTGGKPRAP